MTTDVINGVLRPCVRHGEGRSAGSVRRGRAARLDQRWASLESEFLCSTGRCPRHRVGEAPSSELIAHATTAPYAPLLPAQGPVPVLSIPGAFGAHIAPTPVAHVAIPAGVLPTQARQTRQATAAPPREDVHPQGVSAVSATWP